MPTEFLRDIELSEEAFMVAATPYDALIGAAKSLVDTHMLAACDMPLASAVRRSRAPVLASGERRVPR
jgi:hypothetical protein